MAKSYGVARQDKDNAGGLIGTGAMTVFANGTESYFHVATEGSIIKGPPNNGDLIRSSNVTVFAENKRVAIIGASTGTGKGVGVEASKNVFAGNGKT